MTTVNMHEAKTQLSRLVDAAASGETIIVAKAGRPVAKLSRLDARTAPSRLGFLADDVRIPDDFDDLGAEQIVEAFEGKS